MSSTNAIATTFKGLHQSGNPVRLANVWDTLSARVVASLPSSKALGTSSFAVARANGTEDNDLTLDTNLAAVKAIAVVAKEHNKPLTVDIQDGYGSQLEDAIADLVSFNVAGANLEDFDIKNQTMYSQAEAVARIQRALSVASDLGVPEFVLNARCDVLLHGGTFEDVLARGNAYLAAGATTVFVLPGPQRKITRDDIAEMVKHFGGRLNIGWNPVGALSIKELTELGVARVSVGPGVHLMAMETIKKAAESILNGTQAE